MKTLGLAVLTALAASVVAVPTVASAHGMMTMRHHHHQHCSWVMRHHHRVKVCR